MENSTIELIITSPNGEKVSGKCTMDNMQRSLTDSPTSLLESMYNELTFELYHILNK